MDPITAIMVALVFVGVIGTMILDGVHVTVLIQPAALMLIFVGTFGASAAGLVKAGLEEGTRGF